MGAVFITDASNLGSEMLLKISARILFFRYIYIKDLGTYSHIVRILNTWGDELGVWIYR